MYVPIGEDAVIRCLVMKPQNPSVPEKLPLVMIHGFGCGIVQFYKNLDHLHSDRCLYALDLPGFARSTRIPFPEEAEAAEATFVSSLERWREGVGLEKFILLGHSLGGFISLSYAMTHPQRVRHLILDDPWGLVDPIPDEELRQKFSLFFRGIFQIATKFKPFDWIRGTGPLGMSPHSLGIHIDTIYTLNNNPLERRCVVYGYNILKMIFFEGVMYTTLKLGLMLVLLFMN